MKKIITVSILGLFSSLQVATQVVMAGKTPATSTEKRVLAALMKNLDVKLKDAAHCQSAGTEQTDKTIGDYLSGFWALHANETGKNWLDISTTKSSKGHLARVMLYRKDGEENWGWGVSFLIESTGKVNRKSFTCLGGG